MRFRFVALLAAFGLLGAACGGGSVSGDAVASLDDTTGGSTTTTLAIDTEQVMLEYTQCLRDSGIDIEDPTVDANGNLRFARPSNLEDADRETLQEARTACAPILEGIALGLRQEDRTQIEDTIYEYAACMRENGYDMPDPDFSSLGTPGAGGGEGQPRGPFGSIDPSDPDFIDANEVCQSVFADLPGFLGGARGGPGAGGGS